LFEGPATAGPSPFRGSAAVSSGWSGSEEVGSGTPIPPRRRHRSASSPRPFDEVARLSGHPSLSARGLRRRAAGPCHRARRRRVRLRRSARRNCSADRVSLFWRHGSHAGTLRFRGTSSNPGGLTSHICFVPEARPVVDLPCNRRCCVAVVAQTEYCLTGRTAMATAGLRLSADERPPSTPA
jgi:hypothetical protein